MLEKCNSALQCSADPKKNLGPTFSWRIPTRRIWGHSGVYFLHWKFQKWPGPFSFSKFRFQNSLVARAACNFSKVFRNHYLFWRFSLPNLCDSPRQLAILVVSPQHPPDRRAFRFIQHTNRQKEHTKSVPFGAVLCSSFLFSCYSIFLPSDHNMFTPSGRCVREQ